MKKTSILFALLYLMGLGLAVTAFLLFVSPERRSDIVWLDFCLGIFLYTLFSVRFLTLFRPLEKFADGVPLFTAWWTSFGGYAVFCVGGMVLLGLFEVSFSRQFLIQGVILFFFICSLAVGYGASEWMSRSTMKDREVMDGVRGLQSMAAGLGIGVAELPMDYGESRRVYTQIIDDINTLPGSTSPQAKMVEGRVADLISKANDEMSAHAPEDILLKTGQELRMAVAMRKSI